MTLIELVDKQSEIISELSEIVNELFRLLCMACPDETHGSIADRIGRAADEMQQLDG